MSVILGINSGHPDSSACLVIDGKLVGAVSEERLGKRIKHYSGFPSESIKWLFNEFGVNLSDVTHLASGRNHNSNLLGKIKYTSRNLIKSKGAVIEHFKSRKRKASNSSKLLKLLNEKPQNINFKIVNIEQHIAHIASSYYVSPFDDLTAGISYDASGDFASFIGTKCEGTKIDILGKVLLPDSLGFFYSGMCQFIGFDKFGEEYKVMGLAPYGNDNYKELMEKIVILNKNNWFNISNKFFGMHSGLTANDIQLDNDDEILMERFFKDKLIKILGSPRSRMDPITQREKDIAKSTQVRFEDAAIHCCKKLIKLVPTDKLVLAGGCALNGVANARIFRETDFKNHYIQPAASDDGLCIGAAYWTWHNVLKRKERFHMNHAFFGPSHSITEIKKVVLNNNYKYYLCKDNNELVFKVANLISRGLVIGWYQGRSEFGPRALGNRSILASPLILNMKDLINMKIKRRESFRPFAPSVLKEKVNNFFEHNINSPFMQHVVKIKKNGEKSYQQ